MITLLLTRSTYKSKDMVSRCEELGRLYLLLSVTLND